MKVNFRNIAPWVAIGLLAITVFMSVQQHNQRTPSRDITFSEFLSQIDQGSVHDVTIAGNEISGHFSDNRSFVTYAPYDPSLVQKLTSKNVSITARPTSEGSGWLMMQLLTALPLIALLAMWIFLSRQMRGPGGHPLGFGKSKAKLLTETQGRVTFEDVAGVDEAKEDLQEIVEFRAMADFG